MISLEYTLISQLTLLEAIKEVSPAVAELVTKDDLESIIKRRSTVIPKVLTPLSVKSILTDLSKGKPLLFTVLVTGKTKADINTLYSMYCNLSNIEQSHILNLIDYVSYPAKTRNKIISLVKEGYTVYSILNIYSQLTPIEIKKLGDSLIRKLVKSYDAVTLVQEDSLANIIYLMEEYNISNLLDYKELCRIITGLNNPTQSQIKEALKYLETSDILKVIDIVYSRKLGV